MAKLEASSAASGSSEVAVYWLVAMVVRLPVSSCCPAAGNAWAMISAKRRSAANQMSVFLNNRYVS